ncbi:hypothetical protein GMOD_00006618 [Pyrenophora seminiperda CCB06]|uniref:Uncharacterized protein n=1 Tax=Pyrenophora seminiperda CCB06 TaxID=1302712 RepID=A0A3M7MAM8_9PLEO|nr:hypothetical protein GMOD_00006618 [Pyrenophora seminiperda CCB06]
MAGAGFSNNPFTFQPPGAPGAPTQPDATQPANTPAYQFFPAFDHNTQRALTVTTVVQHYPVFPDEFQFNQIMLHPVAYLPPLGMYWNANNPATEFGGDKYCRTCLEPLIYHDPPITDNGAAFPCTQRCGLAAHMPHPDHRGQPCPKIYISMRLAKRRWRFNNNKQGWYAESQCYPSENEWTVLRANGYIEQGSVYNSAKQPVFTAKAWNLRSTGTSTCTQIEEYKHKPARVIVETAPDSQSSNKTKKQAKARRKPQQQTSHQQPPYPQPPYPQPSPYQPWTYQPYPQPVNHQPAVHNHMGYGSSNPPPTQTAAVPTTLPQSISGNNAKRAREDGSATSLTRPAKRNRPAIQLPAVPGDVLDDEYEIDIEILEDTEGTAPEESF